MLWILICQLSVILPHVLRIPFWVSLFCLLIGVWGFLAVSGKWKYPKKYTLIMLVVFACVAIGYSYKTLIGQDAGVSLLMIMMSLKILEMKKLKDVMLFVFLGYFLVVTNFLFTQTIAMAFYMLIVCIGLTSTLVMLNRPDTQMHLKDSLKLATTLIFQAMPVMLVLFVLFPRLPSPLWAMPKDSTKAITGLNSEMSPGSISKLSQSNAIAFRVNFEDKAPDNSALYWRGPVLSSFNGKTWAPGYLFSRRGVTDIITNSQPVNYTITLEPHHRTWLFALDIANSKPAQSSFDYAYSLQSKRKVTKTRQYRLSSVTNYIIDKYLPWKEKSKYLQLPTGYNPQTVKWANEINNTYKSQEEKITAVLEHLREQPFYYSLSPPLLGRNSVDEFFFKTRNGFCEHYAGSFTYLMRQLGIPARVVLGYQGGEYNDLGNYMIVRQSDAHAWSEVWLEDRGWVRIDPTSTLPPSRVETGIEATFPQRDSSGSMLRADSSILRTLELYWDNINYKWHQWVLGYNASKQSSLLQKLGINSSNWKDIAISILIAVGGLFIIISVWLNIKKRKPATDSASAIYRKFCSRLKKLGYEKQEYEGPIDYAERISRQRHDLKEDIEIITRFYIQLRYGRNPPGKLLSQFRKRVTQFRPS